jgi:hypothetical protein
MPGRSHEPPSSITCWRSASALQVHGQAAELLVVIEMLRKGRGDTLRAVAEALAGALGAGAAGLAGAVRQAARGGAALQALGLAGPVSEVFV